MKKFTRQQRLLHTQDFSQVFKTSQKISFEGIVIYYRNNQHGFARLGLAISKKFIPKAVDRNLIKRIIRESFRSVAEDLASIDIVVSVRSQNQVANKELSASLIKMWHKWIKK